ncbi:MAG: MMPL family transporter, partial [Acidobacteriota bacterium]
VTLLIYAVFRSVPFTLLALLPTLVGFAWAGGLLALAHVELDLFSLFAVVTFIGISVDYGIYILYRRVVEGTTDIGDVVARTAPAIVIACVTALIGFGTLVNSSYGPLQRFGVVSLVTLTCCLIASVVLLPALVLQIDRWSRPAR